MKQAEKLIGRILFLEGIPIVNNLRGIYIGSDVPRCSQRTQKAEEDAIKAYTMPLLYALSNGLRYP
jgi:bacterioferritin